MSGLFGATPTYNLPAFLGGPSTAPAPSATVLSGMSAGVAPTPVATETFTSSTQVELMSMQQDLQTIRKELKRLIAGLNTAQAPAPAPTTPSVIGQAWTNLMTWISGQPAPTQPTQPSQPTQPGKPPKPTKPTPVPPSANGDTNFVMSSFNVLSSSAGIPKGYRSGVARMHDVVNILKANNVGVVGFQEVKDDQFNEFRKIAGDEYGSFAGASGKRGYHDAALAWRKDTWKLVKADTMDAPSYAGITSKVPYVLLENKQTGQRAYFIDAHNPANTKNYHHQEKYRDAAARKEADLASSLMKQTGLPVFVMGDMNSVSEARDIFTKNGDLKAANGPKQAGIDWVFGSKKGVAFSAFRRVRDALIKKTTDHPVVFTNVHIDGK